MIQVFAITSRGLEGIGAQELGRAAGVQVTQVRYRRISATCSGEPAGLLRLRTVDDVFLHLAEWEGIVSQRGALERLTRLAARLRLEPALEVAARLRPLPPTPTFSVTANFVGQRNYSADEIKQAVAAGTGARYGWAYAAEDESQVNLRLFIEHERASVGLRLGDAPLHRRAYKQANLPGSLKPTIAAAMLFVAGVLPGEEVLDPFCGAGTILIEAALAGVDARGGDSDPPALATARANAALAGVALPLAQWDARRLPLASRSVGAVVTNLPWGRQVSAGEDLAALYAGACAEISRALAGNGLVVALTNLPHLLAFERRKKLAQVEISLFGQAPAIVKYGVK
jgi:23S rRNA G2445 N2-methylase RlmL